MRKKSQNWKSAKLVNFVIRKYLAESVSSHSWEIVDGIFFKIS